jgi:hypothetical protein
VQAPLAIGRKAGRVRKSHASISELFIPSFSENTVECLPFLGLFESFSQTI